MRTSVAVLALSASALLLTSCSAVQQQGAKTLHINLQGRAMGGEQPITAATVQLYAVGITTDGGGASEMINQTITPVTTSDGTGVMNSNANAGNNNNQFAAGYFTISGDYTCPSSSTLVYLATIGGNPGIGTNNAQEQLAALGQCGNLTSNTNIVINEVTTVGTVKALLPYMSNSGTTYASVSSTPAHAAALATAFNTAAEYVNVTYGGAPGPNLPAGSDASSNDLRALANVVQNCVNSNGSTGNGSNCGTFFTDAQGSAPTVASDTVTALYDVFADPTNNVTTIFNLQGTTPAFEPTNNTAPTDWTLPILQVPATPVISPNGGGITSSQNITITDTDTDGTNAIYYTTDGTTPSATNGTLYAGAFTLSADATVNAIDIDDNRLSSAVASAAFTVSSAGPTTPTVSLYPISAPFGSTAGVTITATGNDTGSVVTFGTAGSVDGSFSPTTCTIASGSCSVSYIPSGTLAVGIYANDLTASFAAASSYAASSATSTLIIDGTFTLTTLHAFANTTADQIGGLGMVQGPDGNFYGVTGGDYYYNHTYGTVFELTPNGASSTLTVLHTFSGSSDGEGPGAPLVWGSDGALYGTTYQGGSADNGTVFKIVPNGTNSTFTVLHAFAGGSDGASPVSALVQGTDGNLYGTTTAGGTGSYGTIFQIAPDGTYTLDYTFNGTNDGEYAYTPLVQAGNGTFYGTTYSGGNGNGNIFQFVPNGAGSTVTSVYPFQNGTDGASPFGGLAVGADGNLYGTTSSDPTYNSGTVFKFNPTSSSLTTLYQFTGGNDGGGVGSNLFLGSDGNFYGAAQSGGAYSWGTLFSISPSGTLTTVYPFTNGTDGGISSGPLVQGADGSFYGSNFYGGAHGYGTLFELLPSPTFSAPVALTVPASVTPGSSFTLGYAVSNAYGDTMSRCFATNNAGDTTGWAGVHTGSPTVTNVSLTAPSTTGAYTYSLTCGGIESGFTTLTVQ